MKKILFLLPIIFFIISCEDKFSIVESKTFPAQQIAHQNDTVINDTITHSFFSRLHNRGAFGMIYTYFPPDNIRDKPMEIVFSGNARTNYAYSNAFVNVTMGSKKGVQLGWTGRNLRYFFTDINTWCKFRDSVTFKREDWHDPYYRIDVFSYLPNPTQENFDIDTLFVKIKVKN